MARIVFVQNIFREYPAFMALSAELKRSGHYTSVVISRGEKDVISAILSQQPDYVGFSPTAHDIGWCLEIATQLKKTGHEVILGGAMVTSNYDVIKSPAIDYICVGEGELCIKQLLNLKDRDTLYEECKSIPNLVFKKGNTVFCNPIGQMVKELDSLATPDHGIYQKYNQIMNAPTSIFTFMRGCKFNCSFCFNHVVQRIYQNNPHIVRRKSPEYAVREIEETIELRKHKIKVIRLFDSSLLSDKNWANEFLSLYKERIGIPFVCYAHPSEINNEISKQLKNSCCIEVGFGIESGSSYIRNNVLRKASTDKHILAAASALKRNHISFVTFNMLGSPGESFEDALKTIEINRRIKPTLAYGSLTQVYLGTDLERITRDIDPARIRYEQRYGVLDYKHNDEALFSRLLGAFPFTVHYPRLLKLLGEQDVLNKRFILYLMNLVSFFMQFMRPSLSCKEFIKHYILEDGKGLGYF